MVAQSDVIVATFNYRLGSFGWLSTPAGANFGFSDQNNAILWVHSFIKQFGGDPDRITLGGQSAGGLSVQFHLLSQQLLFSQALIHSAPSNFPALTLDEAQVYYVKLAGHLGCQADDFDCLVSQDTSQVLAGQKNILPAPELPADRLVSILPWSPVVDGVLVNHTVPLYAYPLLAKNGPLGRLQVLMGFDKNDTGAWVGPARASRVAYSTVLQSFFGANASAVKQQYPFPEATLMSTDFVMACPSIQALGAFAEAGMRVSGWTFVHSPSSDPWNADTVSHCAPVMGPCHGEELIFVFGTATPSAPAPNPAPVATGATFDSAAEDSLSSLMLSAWASFIRTGVDGSTWPAYTPTDSKILQFNTTGVSSVLNYHADGCAVFESLGLYSP